jgi:exodeoxyribonuclease-3
VVRAVALKRAMKLLSWNVNGVRAAHGKGLLNWMAAADADVICLQEVKAALGDVQHIAWPLGYEVVWNSAQKKGYSGTALLSKTKPLSVTLGLGSAAHDAEGRAITAEFEHCYVIGVYVPNAQPELARLGFRQDWDKALLAYAKQLEKKKPVLLCGDLNVAHEEIDLARPKENVGNPGFSEQERAGFRTLLDAGFIDTFREFEKGPGHYSWWTYRAGARERNVGWRIDYVIASASLKKSLKRAWIEPHVLGSDHCPVGVEVEF